MNVDDETLEYTLTYKFNDQVYRHSEMARSTTFEHRHHIYALARACEAWEEFDDVKLTKELIVVGEVQFRWE